MFLKLCLPLSCTKPHRLHIWSSFVICSQSKLLVKSRRRCADEIRHLMLYVIRTRYTRQSDVLSIRFCLRRGKKFIIFQIYEQTIAIWMVRQNYCTQSVHFITRRWWSKRISVKWYSNMKYANERYFAFRIGILMPDDSITNAICPAESEPLSSRKWCRYFISAHCFLFRRIFFF